MTIKKIVIGSAFSLSLVASMANTANALNVTFDATMDSWPAITANTPTDMDLGSVEYAATHSGAIEIGTNAAAALNTGVGLTLGGAPAAGQVTFSGGANLDITVTCAASATLADTAGTSLLTLTPEIHETAVAFGSGETCDGSTDLTGSVFDGSGDITIFIGGSLAIDSDELTDGGYSTSNSNGVLLSITAVYP